MIDSSSSQNSEIGSLQSTYKKTTTKMYVVPMEKHFLNNYIEMIVIAIFGKMNYKRIDAKN